LGDGRKLYDAARKITPHKPIVVLKAGKTDLGSKAAKSHTGWLAGSYEIAKAAFEQAGMITSENITQMFDIIRALMSQPLPTSSNVAMVTNGAGPCVMAADQLRRRKMNIAVLSKSIIAELTSQLPPYSLLSETTVDLTGSATSRDYELALNILARDPAVSIMMPFFVFQDTPLDEGIVDVLGKVKELRKPIICCAAGGPYTRSMSGKIEAIGIPVYETAERAVDAAHALVRQAIVSGAISVG
jgi:3-hydroxypropionyl-CoA synthetase (ADP-forming)